MVPNISRANQHIGPKIFNRVRQACLVLGIWSTSLSGFQSSDLVSHIKFNLAMKYIISLVSGLLICSLMASPSPDPGLGTLTKRSNTDNNSIYWLYIFPQNNSGPCNVRPGAHIENWLGENRLGVSLEIDGSPVNLFANLCAGDWVSWNGTLMPGSPQVCPARLFLEIESQT